MGSRLIDTYSTSSPLIYVIVQFIIVLVKHDKTSTNMVDSCDTDIWQYKIQESSDIPTFEKYKFLPIVSYFCH